MGGTDATDGDKMPSETLQHSDRQLVRAAISTTPPRLRPKGPLGPDFPRQLQAAAGRPKQSAVERLEADKAKYVKSQVALSKQLAVKAPDARKTPTQFNPGAALRPTRKSPAPLKTRREQVELNLLNNLTNLISDVNDGPQQPRDESQDEAANAGEAPAVEQLQLQSKKEKPRPPKPPPRPDWCSPAKVNLSSIRILRVLSPRLSTRGSLCLGLHLHQVLPTYAPCWPAWRKSPVH